MNDGTLDKREDERSDHARLRTGLFGGTFDPPTIAHLIAAEWALSELNLDELWFIPAWVNPLKAGKRTTDPTLRLEMLTAALGDSPGFRVEPIELERKGYSYTIDTVESLKKQHPNRDFVFVQGVDSLIQLPHWHRYEDLLDAVEIVAQTRPGYDLSVVDPNVLKRIHYLEMPPLAVSATLVRSRVKEGKSIRFLVPRAVEELIRTYNLYSSRNLA